MSTIWAAVGTIVLAIVCSGTVLYLFTHFWSPPKRREHNDLIGSQISVTGTTYAVVVGFMLYAVWTNYQMADQNAEAEANSAVNIYRAAQGLSEPTRSTVRELASSYVEATLREEWPEMKERRFSARSAEVMERLWHAVTNAAVETPLEQMNLTQVAQHLSAMTEHRRMRHQQAVSGIPSILWFVLIAGAVVVIVSACMFGSLNFRVQLVQVSMLSLMLTLILVAIGELSSPFRGAITIEPTAFRQGWETVK